jgi:hypothetical protein
MRLQTTVVHVAPTNLSVVDRLLRRPTKFAQLQSAPFADGCVDAGISTTLAELSFRFERDVCSADIGSVLSVGQGR